jgi:hypothetical protein
MSNDKLRELEQNIIDRESSKFWNDEMNKKLRERQENMNIEEAINILNSWDILLITDYARGLRDGIIDMLAAINTPKHETVEEWEKRTGESYPDDAPVYFRIKDCRDSEWKLHYTTIKNSFKNTELDMIIANHHGKPEIEE